MAKYYVSITGKDSNPGTAAAPKKTIAAGVSLLSKGDTLLIEPGTYIEPNGVVVDQSGTSESRIRIRGDGGMVYIDGKADANGLNTGYPNGAWIGDPPVKSSIGKQQKYIPLLQINGDYITVENVTAQNSLGRGIMAGNEKRRPQNPIFRNVHVKVARNAGFILAYVDNAVINYCSVSGAADFISKESHAYNHAGGLVLKGCKHTKINNSQIFNNWGEGLMVDVNWRKSENWHIFNCDIYNNGWINLYIHATQQGIVERCRIYQTVDWNPENSRYIGGGLGIDINVIEPYSYEKSGGKNGSGTWTNNILLKNNIISGAALRFGRGAENRYPNDGIHMKDIQFVHNTIVLPRKDAIIAAATMKNSLFQNNIVVKGGGLVVNGGGKYSALTRAANVFNVSPGDALLSGSDVVGNPRLENTAVPNTVGTDFEDWYKIQSDSPAIGIGKPLDYVDADYWNNLRDETSPDSGIHEFSSEVNPPDPPDPPDPDPPDPPDPDPEPPSQVQITGYLIEEGNKTTIVFEKVQE